jgi:hypothetical protein
MGPDCYPPASRKLAVLSALFILLFFTFFSYHGLFSYFTFDDGTTVIKCLRPFETPFWQDLLHILTVFTTAFRPLTTLFWRPLYAVFGFNPLPYRIVVHLFLMMSIGLSYVLARRLEATREAAALTALIFCYNASTFDLYYNTCLVDYVECFLLYGSAIAIYLRGREAGDLLSWRRTAAVAGLYLLALDTKEMAVALPGILLIYELLYRRGDFRDRRKTLRVCGLIAAMFVVAAIYLKVKVADMSANPAYAPHATPRFILDNVTQYLQKLLYFPENSLTPLGASLILGGLIALGPLVRSRPAIFGVLYFMTALFPVAVIAGRGGYAAYPAYFGLSLAAGSILACARSHAFGRLERKSLEIATTVGLFLCIAALLACGHLVNRVPGITYYEWSNPAVVGLMDRLQQNIPEFPPNARVLISEDPWGPDWGPMFLVRLMYHDNTVWVDRPKNMDRPPDLASYDLVVAYRGPDVDLSPARFQKHPMKWEIRGRAVVGTGMFEVSSPNGHGAASHVDFAPQAVRSNQGTRVTIQGLSNVSVNALYRMVSGPKSTWRLVENWCTLDARGSCTITAPSASAPGTMMIDWIQPVNQRWIFTNGILSIVE